MGQPKPLFVFLDLFKQTSSQFLQQIYVKKCPFSIQCQDLNPWPSECESLPITTRPGLSPCAEYVIAGFYLQTNSNLNGMECFSNPSLKLHSFSKYSVADHWQLYKGSSRLDYTTYLLQPAMEGYKLEKFAFFSATCNRPPHCQSAADCSWCAWALEAKKVVEPFLIENVTID